MADILEVSRYSSIAAEAQRVVKSSRGSLVGVFMHNGNVGARFLQVFDSPTVPVDGAVPVFSFPVAAGQVFIPNFPAFAVPFPTGISICTSSTFQTKTVGAADALFTALFI